jgi:DNA repair photolyase
MEPRAARPEARLAAVRSLRTAGVPVGVLLAPLIPGLNDHELPALARAAAEAGAQFAGYTVLRLPHGVGAIFADWLERHYPDRKERVLGRVRALHGGVLDDPQFGRRMKGGGAYAATLAQLFEAVCRQAGLAQQAPVLSTASFCRPGVVQRLLFD